MKAVFKNKRVIRFFFRWMVVNLVFFSVKFTMDPETKGVDPVYSSTALFYYLSAFFLFMTTWELNDYLLRKHGKQKRLSLLGSIKIMAVTLGIMIPITAFVYYLGLFAFKDTWDIVCFNPPEIQFYTDVLRAIMLGFTVVFFNMFYYMVNQNDAIEKEMENLKRDMLASQYTSLKQQISPHFLFNSLNTLTALMYEDRDLASDFVTRLASTYRYILDNREHDLVTLKKELDFMDSFIFMMEVRHKNAVQIELNTKVDTEAFLIPTLSLQMLVENALKHNQYSKEKPLHISISTIQEDALVVKNNLQKRPKVEESTKMGLQNIKKRYAYYTNKQLLVREENDYFEVIIPLLKDAEMKPSLKVIS